MDLSSRELRSLKAVHRDQDRLAAPVVGDFRWGKTTGFKPVMATLDFTQNFTQKLDEIGWFFADFCCHDFHMRIPWFSMLISTEISGFHPISGGLRRVIGGFHHERWGTWPSHGVLSIEVIEVNMAISWVPNGMAALDYVYITTPLKMEFRGGGHLMEFHFPFPPPSHPPTPPVVSTINIINTWEVAIAVFVQCGILWYRTLVEAPIDIYLSIYIYIYIPLGKSIHLSPFLFNEEGKSLIWW